MLNYSQSAFAPSCDMTKATHGDGPGSRILEFRAANNVSLRQGFIVYSDFHVLQVQFGAWPPLLWRS